MKFLKHIVALLMAPAMMAAYVPAPGVMPESRVPTETAPVKSRAAPKTLYSRTMVIFSQSSSLQLLQKPARSSIRTG